MKKLIKLLTIDKEFVFNGRLSDLQQILKNLKDINYETLSERELKFTPTISWGTLTMTGGVGFGINVRAFLVDQGSDQLRIKFKTRVRPEHYFLIVLFIFFFIAAFANDEPKWLIPYVFGLWIIGHSWFQFIYRIQENYLVDKVAKKLRLSVM
jgi:hypothetical protein